MLITFSGLDGSGKSTLIEWLRATLEREHGPVTVLHQNDHVGIYAYLRALRDRVFGRSGSSGPPRIEHHPRGIGRVRDALVWSKTVRRLLYPLDLIVFLGYRCYVEKLRRRILIMDRYFYDTLVDVAEHHPCLWLRALAALTPTPDLAVLLRISPQEAFARKGEYTVEYLSHRDARYRSVFPLVRSSIWLPAHELTTAKRTLAQVVRERLNV